jgi:serine/threonine protein kinase
MAEDIDDLGRRCSRRTTDDRGRRLGAYQVQGLLGAGGMSEVYRARDTQLNRDVALKLLPDAFASDWKRRRNSAHSRA